MVTDYVLELSRKNSHRHFGNCWKLSKCKICFHTSTLVGLEKAFTVMTINHLSTLQLWKEIDDVRALALLICFLLSRFRYLELIPVPHNEKKLEVKVFHSNKYLNVETKSFYEEMEILEKGL